MTEATLSVTIEDLDVTIEGRYCSAEPDVGIMHGWYEDIRLSIDGCKKLPLDVEGKLLDQIDEDVIQEALAEGEPGPPEREYERD